MWSWPTIIKCRLLEHSEQYILIMIDDRCPIKLLLLGLELGWDQQSGVPKAICKTGKLNNMDSQLFKNSRVLGKVILSNCNLRMNVASTDYFKTGFI